MNDQKKRANIFGGGNSNKSEISTSVNRAQAREDYEEEKVKGDFSKATGVVQVEKQNVSQQRANLFNDKSTSRERIATKDSEQSLIQNKLSQMVSPGRGDQTLKEFPFLFLASKKYETQDDQQLNYTSKDKIEESSLNIAQINKKHGYKQQEDLTLRDFSINDKSAHLGTIAFVPEDHDDTFEIQQQFLKEINEVEMMSSSDVSDQDSSRVEEHKAPKQKKSSKAKPGLPTGAFDYKKGDKSKKPVSQANNKGAQREKKNDVLNTSTLSKSSSKSLKSSASQKMAKVKPAKKISNVKDYKQKGETKEDIMGVVKATKVQDKLPEINQLDNDGVSFVNFSARFIDEEGEGQGQGKQLAGFNRKEERVKTKIANDILEQLLEKNVMKSEIKKILEVAVTASVDTEVLKTISKKERDVLESIFDQILLKQSLTKFLNEFFNLDMHPQLSERALNSYIKEHLIESVNFALCSEIWNDFLLLPQIMKEDPSTCIDNLVSKFITEVARDALLEEKGSIQENSPSTTPHGGEVTKGYDGSTLEPTGDIESQYQAHEAAIWKYIEDELILGVIYDNVEDMAIIQMQEQYFVQKNMAKFIAEELFWDMIAGETSKVGQDILKKERVLDKSSQNHLDIFLKMEVSILVQEVFNQEKLAPFEIAGNCIESITKKMVNHLYEGTVVKMAYDISASQQIPSLVDRALAPLLREIAQDALSNKNKEESFLQQFYSNIELDVISQIIIEETAAALKMEKQGKTVAAKLGDASLRKIILEVCEEAQEEEIIEQVGDQILKDHLRKQVVEEGIREIEVEGEASKELIDEVIEAMTKQFFFDHFGEIKDQYLKLYKEELQRKSHSSATVSEFQAAVVAESRIETEDFTLGIDECKEEVCIAPYYREGRITTMAFLNFNRLELRDLSSLVVHRHAQESMVLPIDAKAVEVICVNCYECIKVDQVDAHSLQCVQHTQEERVRRMDTSGNNQNILKRQAEEEKKGEEEREQINEINERIFKLHKALKQKQIEMQHNTSGDDLRFLRYLDEFEQMALNVFTNNTNKRELEEVAQDLIEKLQEFKPANGNELSLNITARRLAQLFLQKIELTDAYLHYLEKQENYFDDEDEEELANLYVQQHAINSSQKTTPIKQYSQMEPTFKTLEEYESGYPKTFEEHLKRLEEESMQQKAELEMWRNLHNEMLKNYLENKANNNKFINDINSDVSAGSGKQSEGLSSLASSQTSNMLNQNILSPQRRVANDDVASLDEVEESLRYKQNDDMKRYFYTIAIHNSKKILKSVPQGAILKQLHKKCLEAEVPVGEWDQFIQTELKKMAK